MNSSGFRGGRAHKIAINKCHFSHGRKKKGKSAMGCAARGGEARRHSCKRDRRWEMRRADDAVHFWEGLADATWLAGGLLNALP